MKKLLAHWGAIIVLPICMVVIIYLNFSIYTGVISDTMRYITTPTQDKVDIIYIGDSRIQKHIDPKEIEVLTGLKGYNLGLDGATIVYFNMVLKKYLQVHPRPGYVVINADFAMLNTDLKVYNYPEYQPYLKDSVISASILPFCPWYSDRMTVALDIFQDLGVKPDNVKLQFLKNILIRPSGIHKDTLNGFNPVAKTWESQTHDTKKEKGIYTVKGANILREMIASCKSNGIKVILICSPLYKDYKNIISNYSVIKDSIQNIAITSYTPYWIYSDTYLSDTTAYFYNVEHLNHKGATLFSRMLGNDINHYIKDSTYLPEMSAGMIGIHKATPPNTRNGQNDSLLVK